MAFDAASCISTTGLETLLLSHINADANGNPAWMGVLPINSEYPVNLLREIRSSGADVIVSFGGTGGGI